METQHTKKNKESDKKTSDFISTFRIETKEKDGLCIEKFFLLNEFEFFGVERIKKNLN